jgi:hypothetical protein
LEWSREASELLAYKVLAFKLFENVKYDHWIDGLMKKHRLPKEQRGAMRKRFSEWHSNPGRNWRKIEEYFSALQALVMRRRHPVPAVILNHMDHFIPHSVYHALFSMMKMTPRKVHDIRVDMEGACLSA